MHSEESKACLPVLIWLAIVCLVSGVLFAQANSYDGSGRLKVIASNSTNIQVQANVTNTPSVNIDGETVSATNVVTVGTHAVTQSGTWTTTVTNAPLTNFTFDNSILKTTNVGGTTLNTNGLAQDSHQITQTELLTRLSNVMTSAGIKVNSNLATEASLITLQTAAAASEQAGRLSNSLARFNFNGTALISTNLGGTSLNTNGLAQDSHQITQTELLTRLSNVMTSAGVKLNSNIATEASLTEGFNRFSNVVANAQYTNNQPIAVPTMTMMGWHKGTNAVIPASALNPLPVTNVAPTTISGTVTVDGSGVTQPVSGTVSIGASTNLLATAAKQLADGHAVNVTNNVNLSSTSTSLLATAAKQLANGHDVNVTNNVNLSTTSTNLLATAAKQLADGHAVNVTNNVNLSATSTSLLSTLAQQQLQTTALQFSTNSSKLAYGNTAAAVYSNYVASSRFYGAWVGNTNGTPIYFSLFTNITGAFTPANQPPYATWIVPANTNGAGNNIVPVRPINCGGNLGYAVRGGVATNDNTAVTGIYPVTVEYE